MVRMFMRGEGKDACTIEQSDQCADLAFLSATILFLWVNKVNIALLAQQTECEKEFVYYPRW